MPVGENLGVPEPQHLKARPLEIGGPPGVVGDLIRVLTAVDLDHEAGVATKEIQEIGSPGNLSLPLPAAQAMSAERIPQARFRKGVVAPESAGPGHCRGALEGSDNAHADDENICGTAAQVLRLFRPLPYPLPLRFAGGEEMRRYPIG